MIRTVTHLNKEALDYIIKDIETTCKHLGVFAEFSIKTKQDYRGDEYSVIESTDFQMTPMIFKRIHVLGTICVKDSLMDSDYDSVSFRLEYQYELFDGGSNGCLLGMTRYLVRKDIPACGSCEAFVQRIQSLSI